MCEDLDLTNIISPINVGRYQELLRISRYDAVKTQELLNGFTNGFDIGYRGPWNRRSVSENIPLNIGTHTELWNKIIKEVRLGRVAGPFNENPYKDECYIQSPIGLVPKSGGQTRLIFHLSYNFGIFPEDMSMNCYTPDDECKVKYRDLNYAIRASLHILQNREVLQAMDEDQMILFYSKSDLRAAFRILPILPAHRRFLLYKARNPLTGKFAFFAEKSLPFGASISCRRFQDFSDSLKHIIEFITGRVYTVTNYLDDFLFIEETENRCNHLVRRFISMCEYINCPIAFEKTEWASCRVVFLGILIDGKSKHLAIPVEKVGKALDQLNWAIDKKKVTIKFIQRLTGILNFLNKAIVPGRAFTRGMYQKLKTTDGNNQALKHYHHVNLGFDFIQDCRVWKCFLTNPNLSSVINRPFVDIELYGDKVTLEMYTDATLNPSLGYGGFFNGRWFLQRWNHDFIVKCKPSIAFLELYGVAAAIFTWGRLPQLCNARVAIYCDNESVKYMINGHVSTCAQSRKILRLVALDNMRYNRRVFIKHVKTEVNTLADALSRFQMSRFWKHAPTDTRRSAEKISDRLPSPENIWFSKY